MLIFLTKMFTFLEKMFTFFFEKAKNPGFFVILAVKSFGLAVKSFGLAVEPPVQWGHRAVLGCISGHTTCNMGNMAAVAVGIAAV